MSEWFRARAALLRRLLGGFFIGVAFLVPGISGGALAATLGYFEPAIAALSGIAKRPRGSIAYLTPLALGLAVGALLAAFVMDRVLAVAQTQAISFFIGMVAGTMPKLWRDAYPERPRARHFALIAAGLAVTAALYLFERAGAGMARDAELTLLTAALSGAIFGAGAVVPGISGSFFVIYFGWYKPLLHAVVSFNVPILLAAVAGVIVVALVLVKGVHWLFRRRRMATYSVILGFVAGSLALVWPSDFLGSLWWANLLLLAAGVLAGVAMGHLGRREDTAGMAEA